MLLHNQASISPQVPMPTDDQGQSSQIIAISGETVQLYYSNAGVRTSDAGQAAGVGVQGQLAYENIKDSTGTMSATRYDTSLSFTAGALTAEVDVEPSLFESVADKSFANKIAAITGPLSNGQYVVDYRNGTIWGKKTTTGTTLASAAYKIQSGISGSPVTVASSVKVIGSLLQTNWDYCGVTWTVGTFTEVFVFKTGGAGGTTVNTITVVYTDATKAQLSTVTRT